MSYTQPIDDDDGGEAEREEMIEAGEVRCDCGHVCHWTETDETGRLCGNCIDEQLGESLEKTKENTPC